MGDNIYQRAFIREIRERVYLYTSWPQLYADLPHVRPVRPRTRLRTQMKNVRAQPGSTWHTPPCLPRKKIGYGNGSLRAGSIVRAMKKQFRVEPRTFDLPRYSPLGIPTPYAVVRPVTVRKEWRNESRNPLPEYIDSAALLLSKMGYHVVSVADLQNGAEWALSTPHFDTSYHSGELSFERLMGLVEHAAVVVGGVGWIVPGAISAGVPLVVVLGGQGMHCAPEKLTDNSMPLNRVAWIRPDKFCMCSVRIHSCRKTISDFNNKFLTAIGNVCSTST